MTALLHSAISVTLLHRAVHDCLNLCHLQFLGERSCLLALLGLEELWLQVTHHLLLYSLLKIALHSGVNCGIYLQAVGVQIIVLAIGFLILVTPAEQRILLPVE